MSLIRLANFIIVGLVLFAMCGMPVWVNRLGGFNATSESIGMATVVWSIVTIVLFCAFAEGKK